MDWLAPSTDQVPWWPGFGEEKGNGWLGREGDFQLSPWALKAAEAGTYRITLYLHDESAQKEIPHGFAHLELNGELSTQALGEGSIIGDLTVPFEFTATPDGNIVQGETAMVAIEASGVVSGLPVDVTATISGTSTYDVTSGGTGTVDIEIPEQVVMGMDLTIDAGEGTLELAADAEATETVVQLTSAVFSIDVTSPVPLELNIDASETGDCDVIGDGVALPVEAAQ